MAESISEGTLKTWLKKPGDVVQADEEIATIETDKVCFAAAFVAWRGVSARYSHVLCVLNTMCSI